MDKLEATLKILKLVASCDSFEKLPADKRLNKLLEYFEKIYQRVSSTLESSQPILTAGDEEATAFSLEEQIKKDVADGEGEGEPGKDPHKKNIMHIERRMESSGEGDDPKNPTKDDEDD